jgi:outer membrane protein assembly factor BamB
MRCVALVAVLCVAHGRPSPASGADAAPWEGTWSTPGPALASVLAVDELGTVAAGTDGDVRALDPSGAPIWRSRVEGGHVGNEPALLADLAVVASADRITALERSSGAERWQHRARRGRVAVGVLPDGTDVVLVSTVRGDLALLEAATGALRRTMRLPGSVPSSAPYVWLSGAHGVAAWSTRGACCTVGAVDLENGLLSWSRSVTHRSTVPVVHRGLVIVGTSPRGPRSARVAARDVATGAVTWSTPIVGSFGPSLFGDAAGSDVVIANRAGSVLSLDVGSGSLRWTSDPVEASDEAHPKIAGARVFLTPLSAGAVEIERSSGAVLQSGPFTPEVFVHASAGTADRFEVLVGNGFESAVWAFEPSPIH